MGRKRLSESERKNKITIRIRQELIDKLKLIDNYNKLVEKLIADYFEESENRG